VQTSYRSSITITGDKEIIANIRKNNSKAIAAAMDACNNGLVILEKGAKRDCPVNTDPEDTDTIHLKESIYIEPAKKYKRSVVGRVRVGKKTAMHVEFGTTKMDARPFIRQQIFIHRNEIRNAAREIIKGALGL
jgi:HK97 gp10 family phage protein